MALHTILGCIQVLQAWVYVPLLGLLMWRMRKFPEVPPMSLGRWGWPINIGSMAYQLFTAVFWHFPYTWPYDAMDFSESCCWGRVEVEDCGVCCSQRRRQLTKAQTTTLSLCLDCYSLVTWRGSFPVDTNTSYTARLSDAGQVSGWRPQGQVVWIRLWWGVAKSSDCGGVSGCWLSQQMKCRDRVSDTVCMHWISNDCPTPVDQFRGSVVIGNNDSQIARPPN